MTKTEEINALKTFIQSLPHDSYLRPWLSDIFPMIERDIAGDIIPFVSPDDIREEARKHREEYKAQLAAMHAERERQQERIQEWSDRIISEARTRAEEIEQTTRKQLAVDIARLRSALDTLTI